MISLPLFENKTIQKLEYLMIDSNPCLVIHTTENEILFVDPGLKTHKISIERYNMLLEEDSEFYGF